MPTPKETANNTPKPPVNPKLAAIIVLVGAVFSVAVAYVPALKPVCQAAGEVVGQPWCADLVEIPATNASQPAQ